MGEPLATRRELLTQEDPVREAPRFDASLADPYVPRDLKGYSPSGSIQSTSPAHHPERGRYEGERLFYVAKTRVGFTPPSRERLMA